MNDASRYLSRLTTEITTPQQRLKNLRVMLGLTSDVANGRVSYEVAKFVSDQIDALDTKAEQQGVEDPIASALEIPFDAPEEWLENAKIKTPQQQKSLYGWS